ncbi:MAG: hypothetical protein AB7I27_05540 [Bacteriovoracaceae bacterium]
MNIKIALFFLFISNQVFSFDKDFSTVNDRVPLEFILLFDSLKDEVKTPSEKIQLVGLAQDLNNNLGNLSKEHIFMLMKSEVIKDVLEFKFAKVRTFDITSSLIDKLEEELETKQKKLNKFSLWIWRSIIAELKHRKAMGLITDKSFNPSLFTGTKLSEALRFKKYLSYLMPWIDQMDARSPEDFNNLSKEVSWVILKRLNERSLLFKRFASTAAGDTKIILFNIPQKLLELKPEEIKSMQNDQTPLSLKEQSEMNKSEAKTKMEKISPEDLSPLSEDVARELENKTDKK